MSYKIDQGLLDSHYKVESQIRELIDNEDDQEVKQLFELIVEHSGAMFWMFGGKDGVYSLSGLCNLLYNMHHWIVDDGEFSIVRDLDESLTEIFEEPCYKYRVCSHWPDNGVYVTVKDMLTFLNLHLSAQKFIKENEQAINKGTFEDDFTEGTINNTWLRMKMAPEEYLEKCWKEHKG